jgi:N-methylhydantoinase B
LIPAEKNALDPVTFEVIRHRLWQITNEMGAALIHVSGSPVVTQVNDIMTGIFLSSGEPVSFGPFVVLHFGCNPFAIRAIIQECTADPGIDPDDMFLVNDPWYGAAHQNDMVIAAAIHDEGKLVAWAACMAHQLDVGAMTPGGFTAGASDVYQEGIRFPPVKLVERGRLRRDIFNMLLNNVRVKEVALDLKGQIAANNVARRRMREMFEEFGLDTVLSAMNRQIEFSEKKLRARLSELPDGEYTHLDRIDHDGFSKKVYEIDLKMTKSNDSLTFDFTGSSPQANGVVNCALPATYGGVMGAVGPWLCYDIPWNQGILRPVTIIAEEGTVVNARKPAPVSTASVEGTWVIKTCAQACISKMLASSPMYHDEAQAAWQGGVPIVIISGRDQYNKPFTDYILDIVSGGSGARAHGDGLNACGDSNVATLGLPNIETHEYRDPILFLTRRMVPDSGGAGKYRGGVSCEDIFMPYDTDRLYLNVCAHGVQMPSNTGIFGGYPGSRNQVVIKHDVNVKSLFSQAKVPTNLEEITGELEVLEAKPKYLSITHNDLLQYRWSGGGGYGDPLDRDPQAVGVDVKKGLVTRQFAEKVYGVVLNEQSVANLRETSLLRDKLKETRSKRFSRNFTTQKKEVGASSVGEAPRMGEYLRSSEGMIRCAKCDYVFCSASEDPMRFALIAKVPTSDLGPLFGDPDSSDYVFFEAYCPGCKTRFFSHVMEAGREMETMDLKFTHLSST